jgi:hypothetical protein
VRSWVTDPDRHQGRRDPRQHRCPATPISTGPMADAIADQWLKSPNGGYLVNRRVSDLRLRGAEECFGEHARPACARHRRAGPRSARSRPARQAPPCIMADRSHSLPSSPCGFRSRVNKRGIRRRQVAGSAEAEADLDRPERVERAAQLPRHLTLKPRDHPLPFPAPPT